MWKVVGVMVCTCLGLAILNILLKKELNSGMERLVVLFYMQSVGSIILFPIAFFWERSGWSKLTPSLISQMFLCSLIGVTLGQYLIILGLEYTSATFACAFLNLLPIITFVLAWLLGMEKVDMKSERGKAKVAGALTGFIGVLILSLYKGRLLVSPGRSVAVEAGQARPKRFGPGSAFLVAGSVARSSWFPMQSKIGLQFPHGYSSTSIMSLFSSIQSALLFFIITDRNLSRWILRGEMQILSVIYSGAVGSGLCMVGMSWGVKLRGPVFTAAFSPLIQIFAAVFDVGVLHEEIYLGSIVGSVVVIVGMYVLLWGKSKDQQEEEDLSNRMDKSHGAQDLAQHQIRLHHEH